MHRYVVVDAFTRVPLQGNPVAVLFDCADLPPARMQRVARELNLSETVFLLPARRGADARARIFTPVNELPFAGHPLLGAAVALGETRPGDLLRLETAMGVVPLTLAREGGRVVGARMRQPVPTWRPFERTDELLDALGVTGSTLAALPVEIYRNGPRHVLVGLASVAALSAAVPDQRALARFTDLAAICYAGSGTHWRSRMFSPAYGVAEDAATGSAAGPLAVHLARHGYVDHGRPIEIHQGVELGRPSRMLARTAGAGDRVDRVEVAGDAVTVAHGRLHV
ncbi:PhzF family phenazine biosynthesis isomerase [Streptomyces sp. NPDC056716]|uniref:PhzF family phenazine biosynthesis isomerase n=1 Tax=unclassified Streptomyces TaxID=2593676 RepID=UPI0036BA0148